MNISRVLVSAMLAVSLAGVSVAAMAVTNGSIKVTSLAQVEVETVGADGQKHIQRAPIHKAVPGDEVIFSDTFENVGKKPAGDIVINNPIPDSTQYQSGSAYGEDTAITFSVDGGKTFAAPSALKVVNADGSMRAANSTDYTHIRWTYKKQLAPGATGEVGFRAIIK